MKLSEITKQEFVARLKDPDRAFIISHLKQFMSQAKSIQPIVTTKYDEDSGMHTVNVFAKVGMSANELTVLGGMFQHEFEGKDYERSRTRKGSRDGHTFVIRYRVWEPPRA